MPGALRAGYVDAVVTYPPISNEIIREADGEIIFTSTEIPGEVVDVISFDETVIKRWPHRIRAIRRAWDRAIAYSAENPDEAHAIMAAHARLTVDEFRDGLNGIRVLTTSDQAPLFASGGPMVRAIDAVYATLTDVRDVEPARLADISSDALLTFEGYRRP